MLWDSEIIARLLEQYKQKRVLWDPRHHQYSNSNLKHAALKSIQEALRIPVSPTDIHRKYKTMRAAYQVELRNINAAQLRGFFYKPSLHWFETFHNYMKEIKKLKGADEVQPTSIIEQNRTYPPPQTEYRYIRVTNDDESPSPVRSKRPVETVQATEEVESSEEESTEESEDEFQSFADHIAEQLRSMSVHRAVMIQNQIQRLFSKDREMNGEGENEEEPV